MISFITIGGILSISFVVVEWKVAKFPVMPLRLFERPAAKILFMHNFITGIIYYTDLYYLPLYYQVVLGHSALISGVLILPLIMGFSAASASGGFILSYLGRSNPIIWTGYVLWTAGAGGRIAFGENSSVGLIVGCLLIEGFGIGWVFQPVMIALLANNRKEDRAVVTSLRNFLRTTGGAIGLAIGAAIINNVLAASLPSHISSANALQLTTVLNELSAEDRDAIRGAYMKGLKIVFQLGCPLSGVCLITSLFLTDVPLATAYDRYKTDTEKKAETEGQQKAVLVQESSGIEMKSSK